MAKSKYEKPTIRRYAPLFIGSPGKPSFQDGDVSFNTNPIDLSNDDPREQDTAARIWKTAKAE